MRLWDNFFLEGTIYIIKTALGILKYFELELKLSTFDEIITHLKSKRVEVNETFLFETIEIMNVLTK